MFVNNAATLMSATNLLCKNMQPCNNLIKHAFTKKRLSYVPVTTYLMSSTGERIVHLCEVTRSGDNIYVK